MLTFQHRSNSGNFQCNSVFSIQSEISDVQGLAFGFCLSVLVDGFQENSLDNMYRKYLTETSILQSF